VKIITILRKTNSTTMLGRISMDPFRVLIATALSARTKDETTEVVAKDLFLRYPDAEHLARASVGDIEHRIRRIGFFRVKARRIIRLAQEIRKRGGRVPATMEGLTALPGVGRKTAACVLCYAFGRQAIAVDTHVHRISNRLGLVAANSPEQTERELMRIVPRRLWKHVNDTFVGHGKTICRPVRPRCWQCPVSSYCAYFRTKHKKPFPKNC
jgi:endonuclease-3